MNQSPKFGARRQFQGLSALVAAVLAAGCAQMGIGGKSSDSANAPATTTAAAAPAAAPASKGTPPGMNAQGEVVDSKKIEEGHGQRVKGMGEWEGEITGKPAPGSKFTQLQIGMGTRQATDIVGPPSDQGGYVTGKAFIPWYFGSGKYRHEMVYKGMGRLIFASPSGFDFSNANLVWIIHNRNEGAYR